MSKSDRRSEEEQTSQGDEAIGAPSIPEPPTISAAFLATVDTQPDTVALRWRREGGWAQWTWEEYANRSARVAWGFRQLGVGRGDRVLLMLRNRPEFHVADMAALLIGAIPISLYNSSSAEQIRYFARHSRAVMAVVDGPTYLERFLAVRDAMPDLRYLVVVFDMVGTSSDDIVSLDRLLDAPPIDLRVAAEAARPQDVATFIYTSGTTGPPKAVIITHANVASAVGSLLTVIGHSVARYRMVSFLPMAHVAERVATHYLHAFAGTEVVTCPEAGRIIEYLRDVRPQVVFGVPRIWEKARAAIESLAAADPDRQADLDKALRLGREVFEAQVSGRPLPRALQVAWKLADTHLGAVRDLLGLDQCEIAVTAAAPIGLDVLVFFRSLGVPLSELYGMSESTGPLTWDPYEVQPGDVGGPVPRCEVKVAPDGEIMARGPNIFPGYFGDQQRTADTLDADGWLHTGDLGVYRDNRLRVVGRKKDLIITSGGENISPANIEAALSSAPLISQVCVAGDRRPHLVALLTLDPDALARWATAHLPSTVPADRWAREPDVRSEVDREVTEVSSHLGRLERIKRWAILDDEWPPDSDEVTATMKLKRHRILDKYALLIDSLYESESRGSTRPSDHAADV